MACCVNAKMVQLTMQNDERPRQRSQQGSLDGFITRRPKQPQSAHKPIDLSQTPASPSTIPAMSKRSRVAPSQSPDDVSDSMLNKTLANPTYSQSPNAARKGKPSKRKISRLWRWRGNTWSWKRRIATTLALLVLVAVGAGAWDVWQLAHKVNHLAVGNLSASVGGAENILVAGSTNRCNLKVQNAEWGFCSQGVTGVNSDVIFIVHIVPKTNTVSLLSIPRDTFVPNARSGDEAFKIDAALYEGPTQLVNAVQEDFGIPIQHYAEVGFDGFVNIVNAVGGIKMDFPMPVYDSESYLDVKTPGCQVLNGVEALQVVRARHLQYDPPGLNTSDVHLWPQEVESDIARIARTHEFLRVLASTVAAQGIGNPITDQKLVDAIAPQIQVDNGLSTSAMLQLLEELHAVNINNVPQYTLPISTTAFGSYDYGGTNYGDVVFPSEAVDQQIINKFLGVSNSTDTMTGKPLPSLASVTVSVINGSGTPDQASQTQSGLQALGFNMTGTPGTATPLSSEAVETVVNYANPSTEADAEAVARQLTGPVILSQNASQVTSGADVTVLTGTGLSVNAPANSASSSTTAAASTSASSAAATSSTAATGLEPASSAMQPLSAWDPRACST
jgi:LCP family protein required for cell wall assembly